MSFAQRPSSAVNRRRQPTPQQRFRPGSAPASRAPGRESIYNLIPREVVVQERPPMYRSKHDPNAPITGSTFGTRGTNAISGAGRQRKSDYGLFGPRNGSRRARPANYLKKGSGCGIVKPLSEMDANSCKYVRPGQRRADVPRRSERPVMGLKTAKNFVTANAVEAILKVPALGPEGTADYLGKADYGRVPAYLSQVKAEIAAENEMIDEYVREQMAVDEVVEEPTDPIDEAERQELVDLLKTKWDSENARYQKMCHQTLFETGAKVKRKEDLEASMDVIEADIKALTGGQVYVRRR